jgi:hypothetical protein
MPNDGGILAGERKHLHMEHPLRCRIHPGVFEDSGQLRPLSADVPFGHCFRNQQMKEGVFPIPCPARRRSPFGRDLPLVCFIREVPNIDLGIAGLIGHVGDKASVGDSPGRFAAPADRHGRGNEQPGDLDSGIRRRAAARCGHGHRDRVRRRVGAAPLGLHAHDRLGLHRLWRATPAASA